MTLEKPQMRNIPQLGAYIHRVKPSHLSWWAVLRILLETESMMMMTNTMICSVLVAQFRRF